VDIHESGDDQSTGLAEGMAASERFTNMRFEKVFATNVFGRPQGPQFRDEMNDFLNRT